MLLFPENQRSIPLETLITRWNKIHRSNEVAPKLWGGLYLLCLIPILGSFFTLIWSNWAYSIVLWLTLLVWLLSSILLAILFGTKIKHWYAYQFILPKLLAYDELCLTPCLITAVQRQQGHNSSSERLTHYLNTMTIHDFALLKEKDYAGLHKYLLTFPQSYGDYWKIDIELKLAIIHVIETMGHTQSLPTISRFVDKSARTKGYETSLFLAAQRCQNTLTVLQEKAQMNSHLLRPSPTDTSSKTLLRAAAHTTVSNTNYLLQSAIISINTTTNAPIVQPETKAVEQ